jgi:tRNA-specific 2-thiouridylase
MKRDAVTVAFSGGKDSTAAALLLREQGHEVRALTMRLGVPDEDERLERIADLARAIAVPWQVVDLRREFSERVVDRFADAYRRGLTPNPCVECNRHVKFGLLLQALNEARAPGSLATGHYAAKVRGDGGWFLSEPVERRKSQIYFLAMIDPGALERVVFPLAGLTVTQVRRKVAGLPLASAGESQDACFLQGGDLAAFLRRRLPDAFRSGDFLDRAGQKIGGHDGALHFTVGQRRGTGHAAGCRLYVVGRDLAANAVTLGDEADLLSGSLVAGSPVYWRPLKVGEKLAVKVRYERQGHEAMISEAVAGRIGAAFSEPVRAVTPGQYAVFYDGDRIVAAGEIQGGNG